MCTTVCICVSINLCVKKCEFFKFMSEKYEGFHLDWFTDYSGKIEKTNVKGEKSIKTSKDVTLLQLASQISVTYYSTQGIINHQTFNRLLFHP